MYNMRTIILVCFLLSSFIFRASTLNPKEAMDPVFIQSNSTYARKLSKKVDVTSRIDLPSNDNCSSMVREHFSDVLVVVHYNYPAHMKQILFHFKLWEKVFPNMVLFGPWDESDIKTLSENSLPVFKSPDDVHGYVSQRTFLHALRLHNSSKYGGYLYIQDDLLVSTKNLVSLDKNKLWLSEGLTKYEVADWNSRKHDWMWFNSPQHGIDQMQKILDSDVNIYNAMSKCEGNAHTWFYCSADFFYLPSKMLPSFMAIIEVFSFYNLFFEIAIPTWMTCFSGGRHEMVSLSLCTSWDPRYRNDIRKFGPYCPPGTTIVHPVKYSQPAGMEFAKDFLEKNAVTC